MKEHLQDLKSGGRPMTKNELKIKELQERIDKAIEYIKSNDLLNERNFMETGIDLLFKELLEILGGNE